MTQPTYREQMFCFVYYCKKNRDCFKLRNQKFFIIII